MLARQRRSLNGNCVNVKVWDLPVRVFHWTLVVSVIGAFVTNQLGVSYFKWHVFFGYVILVSVAFRIVWGVAGTRNALFRSFIRSPVETFHYSLSLLRGSPRHYAGHNPLGGLMVVALLAALGVQAVTGLFGDDEIFNTGPLSGYVSRDFSLLLTSLHRNLFYGIAIAVFFHVLAVMLHSLLFGEGLVRAMFTGRKPVTNRAELAGAESSRIWLAIALCVALSLILAAIVIYAPVQGTDSTI